ncbi:hypothetical protein ACF0H5_017497 [Mactra antiquata]
MKKKDKRKKDTKEPLEKLQSIERKEDHNDGRSVSKSRSRSRNRRSLSSLFRRSGSRPQSGERRTDNEDNEENEIQGDNNVRTDPRGHLQRMTVREALVYDRKRGRSPNRRALRLEKRVLSNDSSLNSDLSSSVPYLSDNAPREDQYSTREVSSSSVEARSGSTLPRAKRKKRSRLDGDSAQNNPQTLTRSNLSTNKILPLDKRKYLINQDSSNETNVSIANSEHNKNPTLVHSNTNLDHHKSDIASSESYNQFIALREKRSPIAFSQVDVPDSTPLLSRSKSPAEGVDHTTYNENKEKQSILENTVKMFMTKTKRPSVHYENHRQSESTIPEPEPRVSNEPDQTRRSSYISPRRFSRATRPSLTSNKSDMSDTSVFSHTSDPKPNNSNESGNVRVKYQRHFSRDRKRPNEVQDSMHNTESKPIGVLADLIRQNTSEPQKLDASTSMTSLLNRHTSTSSSHGDQPPNETTNKETITVDIAVETDKPILTKDLIEPIEETIVKVEDVKVEEEPSRPPLSPFLREVVVIDNNAELPERSENDRDCVFRPIQSEFNDDRIQPPKIDINDEVNHERKHEDTGDEIQLIASNIESEDNKKEKEQKSKEHKKRKNSTFSFKRKKSKVKKNSKHTETPQEVLEDVKEQEPVDKSNKRSGSAKNKKEKNKSKKEKDNKKDKKVSIENQALIENDAGANESVSKEKETDKSKANHSKKTKGILKKKSKEALKKGEGKSSLKRTSSLNRLLDPRESQVQAERRLSITMLGKRSASLDNLTTDKQAEKSINSNAEKPAIEPKVKAEVAKSAKSSKPTPKLSLGAIITMRAKISRMKKAKQEKEDKKESSENNEESSQNEEVAPKNENDNNTENSDLSVAKVFYENEINSSIGKSDENGVEIIEATDKEVKDIVFEKQVQFAPFCEDTISEEEMIKQRQRNTRLTSRRESKVRQRQKKVISCCKQFIAFLFSHIGLCSVVVAYCILGGFIFKTLEGQREIEKKKEVREITQNYTEMIHLLAFQHSLTKGDREKFKHGVNEILTNFSVVIHKQTKEAGWDGKDIRVNPDRKEGEPEAEPEQWSYPSSLLYAITVMTTIGE